MNDIYITAKLSMANAGKEFSAKNIGSYFENLNEEQIDKKTIYRYLDKMEKACLIDRVKRFNIVGKQAMTYVEKQYAVDIGFRMINTNLVNIEDTFFLENIIYNELVSRDYEVFVGKTYKGEIDFVVIDGKKKCFIQVLIMENGKIYPVEIKMSADPGKNALKNFSVLSSLNEEIGEGAVLCMTSAVIPLDEKNKMVPIKVI